MLANTYRFTALNDSGASSDVTVSAQAWKFNSSGEVVYSSWTTRMSAVTIADGATGVGSTVDNSTDKYIGANVLVTATGAGTAGVITVFLEYSADGGTTWPDAQGGIPIGSLDAGETRAVMVA